MQTGDASSVYTKLEQDRDPFLSRARQCARFTIPHLMPEGESEPGTRGQKQPEPWQSFGARAVNNLNSKLTLTLLPLNAKFFRLAVDEGALQDLEALENSRVEVEQQLAQIEDMVIDKIEKSTLRTKIGEAIAFTEVAGNALVHVPATRPPRVYRLDTFGIERDPRGNLMQVVIRERVAPMVLEERIKARFKTLGVDVTADGHKNWVEVFTRLRRDTDGKGKFVWKEWQEVNGRVLAKVTTHKFERNPYIHVRGGTMDGESYGRSHCEQYLGDLRALDALSKYLQQGTAQAAKTVWGIARNAPAGLIRRLKHAKNGGYVIADEGSVWPITLAAKSADFATVRSEIQDLSRNLGMAFLMNSTVPRNAERVTAEEIRLVASELDDTLGGTFSLLSSDLQLPLVNIILGNMQEAGEIDELPSQVRPVIVTGLDAIGRGHDLARLDNFLGGALQVVGPDALQSINVNVYMRLRAIALGINEEQLIKSDEQLAQEQQAQLAQEAAMKLGPQLLQNAPPEALAAAAEQLGGAQAS